MDSAQSSSAADVWHSLLRPQVELTPEFCEALAVRMRSARLTSGDRIHCPFLRPFFLDGSEEMRVARAAEGLAALGERVVLAAMQTPRLLTDLALRDDEIRLARINPGYPTASTASRLDAFVLSDSLQFAGFDAESPGGLGSSQVMAEIFEALHIMDRFKERFEVRSFQLIESLRRALLQSYREWGGKETNPTIAIVDWPEVSTSNEFETLAERLERLESPTVVCDPRELVFAKGKLSGGGRKIDIVYRRILTSDVIERPEECAALVNAYEAQAVCVANTFRGMIPHKKAFFAVLTDERNEAFFRQGQLELIRRHVPWTRVFRETRTTRGGQSIDLVDYVWRNRAQFVLKPNDEYGGTGVVLGWEARARDWDDAIGRALGDETAWVVQERIAARRESFPRFDTASGVENADMLVDLSPYVLRGRFAGFLVRLSATGMASVVSGGQVPAFIVRKRVVPTTAKKRN